MKSVLVFALFVCFFFVTLTAKTVDQTDILNAEAEGEMMRGSVLDGVLVRRETRDLDKQKNKNKDKKSKLKSKDKPDKVKKKNGKTSKRKLKRNKNKKEGKGNNKKQKGTKREKRKKKKRKGQKKKKSKDKRKKKRKNKKKKLSAGADPRSKRNTTCSTETVAATCLENAQTALNYEKNQVRKMS